MGFRCVFQCNVCHKFASSSNRLLGSTNKKASWYPCAFLSALISIVALHCWTILYAGNISPLPKDKKLRTRSAPSRVGVIRIGMGKASENIIVFEPMFVALVSAAPLGHTT